MAVFRFEPFRDPVERLISMAATGTRTPLGMPMDIYRTKDGNYHVEADLPGVEPGSIEVTVEHGTLTITAERAPGYGDSEQVIVAERPQGSFTRQLSLVRAWTPITSRRTMPMASCASPFPLRPRRRPAGSRSPTRPPAGVPWLGVPPKSKPGTRWLRDAHAGASKARYRAAWAVLTCRCPCSAGCRHDRDPSLARRRDSGRRG
jgi:HSP20 family molecular chaperone IbpA